MPRTKSGRPTLSAGQAQYVLNELIRRRRVSAADIRTVLGELDQEIATLEQRLASLRGAPVRESAGSTTRPAAKAAAPAPAGVKKRRRPNLSPERRAALRLQGHYLALMRQTPASKRAKFRALRNSKGTQAAIDALRKTNKN